MPQTYTASDHVYETRRGEQIDPTTTVPDQPASAPGRVSNRTNQQGMLATSVQTRILNEIITGSNTTATHFSLPDATTVTFNSTLTNNQNQQVLGVPDISVYIGITDISQVSDATQWPNSTVGASNFPIYFNPSDWGMSDGINQVARTTCRNNTGSPQDVLHVVHWRVIAQPQIIGSER